MAVGTVLRTIDDVATTCPGGCRSSAWRRSSRRRDARHGPRRARRRPAADRCAGLRPRRRGRHVAAAAPPLAAGVLVVVTAAIGLVHPARVPRRTGLPDGAGGPLRLRHGPRATGRRTSPPPCMVAVLAGLRYAVDRDVGVDDLALVGCGAAAVLAADAMRGRREAGGVERSSDAWRRTGIAIARDLHDSVAHSMATINVQAGVAAHVVERQPEQAAAALEAIRVASRDVLDELAAHARPCSATRTTCRTGSRRRTSTALDGARRELTAGRLRRRPRVDGTVGRRLAGRVDGRPTASCRRR